MCVFLEYYKNSNCWPH